MTKKSKIIEEIVKIKEPEPEYVENTLEDILDWLSIQIKEEFDGLEHVYFTDLTAIAYNYMNYADFTFEKVYNYPDFYMINMRCFPEYCNQEDYTVNVGTVKIKG